MGEELGYRAWREDPKVFTFSLLVYEALDVILWLWCHFLTERQALRKWSLEEPNLSQPLWKLFASLPGSEPSCPKGMERIALQRKNPFANRDSWRPEKIRHRLCGQTFTRNPERSMLLGKELTDFRDFFFHFIAGWPKEHRPEASVFCFSLFSVSFQKLWRATESEVKLQRKL